MRKLQSHVLRVEQSEYMVKISRPLLPVALSPDIKQPLFHYTNISAFQSIIENRELWLTDSRCLNDNDDSVLLKKIFMNQKTLDLWKDCKDCKTTRFVQSLYNFYSYTEYASLISKRYVFSCSLVGDKSSFWLTDYADRGAGVCIEFNQEATLNFDTERHCEDNPPSFRWRGFHIWSSQYSIDSNTVDKSPEALHQLIEEYLFKYSGAISRDPTFFHGWFWSLFKSPCWSHEQEVRFIIDGPIDDDGHPVHDNEVFYRKGMYGLCPYKKLYMPKGYTDYLNKVILGPKISNNQQIEIVSEFLSKNGFKNIEVVPSNLSIR